MQNIRRQHGMTAIGWLIVLILIGIFVTLGLKIGPVYLENFTVKSILKSLKDEPFITQKPAAKVKSMVMRRLDLNGVYDLKKESISVKRTAGIMRVNVDYTVQKKIIGNLEALMTFSDNVELISN